jgi:hypothetical protein
MGARQARGRESEFIIARLYQRFGASLAEAVPKFLSGRDIRKVPQVAPEVKSAVGFDVVSWTKQARKNALPDEFPVVHYRPNGYGESKIDDWPVIMRTADFMRLLVLAGILPGENNNAE